MSWLQVSRAKHVLCNISSQSSRKIQCMHQVLVHLVSWCLSLCICYKIPNMNIARTKQRMAITLKPPKGPICIYILERLMSFKF